jgi:hypothetical protein
MNDPYHAEIRALIEKEGALGVNALSKAINVPLSTVQKYMHRQSYFKMNSQRKWDMPDKIATETIQSTVNNFETVIESQVTGITSLSDMLVAQIKSTITLLSAQKGLSPSVAVTSSDIHPEILELDKKAREMQMIFNKYVGKCPEEYRDLIKNLDIFRLIKEKGTIFLNEGFNVEITSLFLEKSVDLSNEVLKVLEEYQKEAKL